MLSEAKINEAHRIAVAQSGPRKGKLKAKCPPMGTLAAAYWQGAMMAVNPHKVSIAQMIFFTDEQREMFELVKRSADDVVAKRRRAA